jgi:hypothetical protein
VVTFLATGSNFA